MRRIIDDGRKSTHRALALALALMGLGMIGSLAFGFGDFGLPGAWFVLAGLTAAGTLFPLRVTPPGCDETRPIGVGGLFVFASLIAFGAVPALLTSAIHGIAKGWRGWDGVRRLEWVGFEAFRMVISAFIAAAVLSRFQAIPVSFDRLQPYQVPTLPAALLISALSYTISRRLLADLGTRTFGLLAPVRRRPNLALTALSDLAKAYAGLVVSAALWDATLLVAGVVVPTAIFILGSYWSSPGSVSQPGDPTQLCTSAVTALAEAIDAKDGDMHSHNRRVQAMTLALAGYCGLQDEKDLEGLRVASLLHDVGKLATPDYILNKPGPLNEWELERMKDHAALGAGILSSIPFDAPVVPIVRHHHERWDGAGYPAGLRGEEIPAAARVLSVVDCYDALRSDRPYRPHMSRKAALGYIKAEAGRAYDPLVVERFLNQIDELEKIADRATAESRRNRRERRRLFGVRQDWSNTAIHDLADVRRQVLDLQQAFQRAWLSLAEILPLTGESLRRMAPGSSCCVYLVDAEGRRLTAFHASGSCRPYTGKLRIPIGEGAAGWVAAHRLPLINASSAGDFDRCARLKSKLRSCLAAPMLMGGNLVGVISLYSPRSAAFEPRQLRILQGYCRETAAAIADAMTSRQNQLNAADTLTGFLRRRDFRAFGERMVRNAVRRESTLTLMIVDMSPPPGLEFAQFPSSNDVAEAGRLLRRHFRRTDRLVLYRERQFRALLPGLSDQAARRVADKVKELMASMFTDGSTPVHIGLATCPDQGRRLDQLVLAAEQELVRDKVVKIAGLEWQGALSHS